MSEKEMAISSSLIAVQSHERLTPSMRSAIWEIGAVLDEMRVSSKLDNALWLNIPAKRLRGGKRQDNQALKPMLDRLCGVYLTGEYRGDEWGAVLLAEWKITQGGSMVELLIPPSAVSAIQAPSTFAKVESRAAHSLSGYARQLYVILADKKRLQQKHWTWTVKELRALLGVDNKKAYDRWNNFYQRILKPALEQINDFGTVEVKMTTKRLGRSIEWVRFDWKWKDPQAIKDTNLENERHSSARHKSQKIADAPPMIEENQDLPQEWWENLSEGEREEWRDKIGRNFEAGGEIYNRREKDIMAMAYATTQERE